MTVLLTVGKRPSAYDDHIHTVCKKEKVIVKWEIIDALCKEINSGNTNKYIEQVTCSQSLYLSQRFGGGGDGGTGNEGGHWLRSLTPFGEGFPLNSFFILCCKFFLWKSLI